MIFERFALELAAFHQVVQVNHVGVVVLAVVVFRVSAEMCGSSAFFSYGNAGNSNDIASSFTAPFASAGESHMGRFYCGHSI